MKADITTRSKLIRSKPIYRIQIEENKIQNLQPLYNYLKIGSPFIITLENGDKHEYWDYQTQPYSTESSTEQTLLSIDIESENNHDFTLYNATVPNYKQSYVKKVEIISNSRMVIKLL